MNCYSIVFFVCLEQFSCKKRYLPVTGKLIPVPGSLFLRQYIIWSQRSGIRFHVNLVAWLTMIISPCRKDTFIQAWMFYWFYRPGGKSKKVAAYKFYLKGFKLRNLSYYQFNSTELMWTKRNRNSNFRQNAF